MKRLQLLERSTDVQELSIEELQDMYKEVMDGCSSSLDVISLIGILETSRNFMDKYMRHPRDGGFMSPSLFNKSSPSFIQLWRKSRVQSKELYVSLGSHIEYRRSSDSGAHHTRMGRIKWLFSVGRSQHAVVQKLRWTGYKHGPRQTESEIETVERQPVSAIESVDPLRKYCGYFELCDPSYFVNERSYEIIELAGDCHHDLNQFIGFYPIIDVPMMQPDFSNCIGTSSSIEELGWEQASHFF